MRLTIPGVLCGLESRSWDFVDDNGERVQGIKDLMDKLHQERRVGLER